MLFDAVRQFRHSGFEKLIVRVVSHEFVGRFILCVFVCVRACVVVGVVVCVCMLHLVQSFLNECIITHEIYKYYTYA